MYRETAIKFEICPQCYRDKQFFTLRVCFLDINNQIKLKQKCFAIVLFQFICFLIHKRSPETKENRSRLSFNLMLSKQFES